ncbi:hypothetical protein CHE218_21380 [Microbacterium sp. che218]
MPDHGVVSDEGSQLRIDVGPRRRIRDVACLDTVDAHIRRLEICVFLRRFDQRVKLINDDSVSHAYRADGTC